MIFLGSANLGFFCVFWFLEKKMLCNHFANALSRAYILWLHKHILTQRHMWCVCSGVWQAGSSGLLSHVQ